MAVPNIFQNESGDLPLLQLDENFAACLLIDGSQVATAPIPFSAGSASLPGITFAGDTNSGVYSIGPDNVGVAVNGSKVLDINATRTLATGNIQVTGSAIFNSVSSHSGVFTTDQAATDLVFEGSDGSVLFKAIGIASAVSYWQAVPAIAGFVAQLAVNGAAGDIDGYITSKGAGGTLFRSGGGTQFAVDGSTTNVVNAITAFGAATGNPASLRAQGSDGNVGFDAYVKGAANYRVRSAGGINLVVDGNTASVVNQFTLYGAATTAGVAARATGTDNNIAAQVSSKGSSSVLLQTAGGATAGFEVLDGTAGNHITVTPDAATPILSTSAGDMLIRAASGQVVDVLGTNGNPASSSPRTHLSVGTGSGSSAGFDFNTMSLIAGNATSGICLNGGSTAFLSVGALKPLVLTSLQAVQPVNIQHNGSTKINTSSTGAAVTGNLLTSGCVAAGGVAAAATTALATPAGTTGVSSLNIPHGVAPTAPVNGDMWTTTAGLFVRINGATVGPLS